ncbi:uncharacterized protein TRIREDRAFT_66256 [Trichoderma reesei QM6a]|uniref:Predicted protein n=2 Tax=Hypocrea jecorina TaxID=51453 RepID=G0RQU3_HYPJQ|nr:uncharacterized protein TRIREDRAFT_66256 [Trichoderma reesei QM6a]EGR46319.1 predicted protein [Trichoderma reesei QM6a]ETR99582.1 NAD(P)-binding protein [Trichoderma reesei RUT C-30]
MPSTTTHTDFGPHTTALTVAAAFPSSISGKAILITGVNLKGLGYATAEAFASQNAALIIIAGRTPSKLQECADALAKQYPNTKTRLLELDLGTQKSVREAAARVNSWDDVPTIDIVVNNAGIMNVPTRQLNEDGIERHFATNHIGHFLFTSLIMSKIIAAAQKPGAVKGATRVVNVSSTGANYSPIRWSDINWEKPTGTLPLEEAVKAESYIHQGAYGQSKTANSLFSLGLNERLYEKYGILSFAVHPGVIITELSREVPHDQFQAGIEMLKSRGFVFKELGAGASTSLVAATGPEVKGEDGEWDGRGVFLSDCQILENTKIWYTSWSQAEKLWAKSEELVGEKFVF